MASSSQDRNGPHLKHLVLLGGGHAQIAVLKSLVMKPIPGLRITLISRDVMTPYSGMLPGYLEGHYHADEITIDLSHLARLAGARFINDAVTGIDPSKNLVRFAGRPDLHYDVLSVNIGSNPDLSTIDGAAEHAVPIKPISTLLERISPLLDQNADTPNHMTIIGGGAAGVEVVLSLDHYMKSQLKNTSFRLIHRGARIMPEFPERSARILMQDMADKGIDVVTGIGAARIGRDTITLADGTEYPSDQTLVVTQGRAPSFLQLSGIALDDRGFIAVRPTLQSTSHDNIFAAGDIATVISHPRPKAGVFAVRAGAVLTRNLRAYLHQDSLKAWVPQKNYLALVGTGGGKAMPIRGAITLPPSRWAWQLKEWIDKRFIDKFKSIPEMAPPPPPPLAKTVADDDDPSMLAMRCLGCGAKTGWSDLAQAISRAEAFIATNKAPKVDVTSDAAIVPLSAIPPLMPNSDTDIAMVQSIDAISAIVDDPFLLGRIAALHALSDLYASDARPHHALALLTLPAAMANLQSDDITHILAGAMQALDENGAYLAGGHTAQAEGDALQVGFAVTGFRAKTTHYKPKDGDFLILTKPLGIGMIMAGHNHGHGQTTGQLRDAAIAVMSESNGIAAEILAGFGAFPKTDVTGFGLVRHLTSLLDGLAADGSDAAHYSAELVSSAIPLITSHGQSVRTLAEGGIESSLARKNKAAASVQMIGTSDFPEALLYDPQTGGGLLAIVPHDQGQQILDTLLAAGVTAAHIGRIHIDHDNKTPPVKVNAVW